MVGVGVSRRIIVEIWSVSALEKMKLVEVWVSTMLFTD